MSDTPPTQDTTKLCQQETVDATPDATPQSKLPKAWLEMSSSIRLAIRNVKTQQPPVPTLNPASAIPVCDTGLKTPPTDYYLAITDEIREIAELKLNRGDLTANRAEVSFNKLCSAVREYNQLNPKSPINLPALLYQTHIVKKDDHVPEVLLEKLEPTERLRLEGNERRYQKMVSGSMFSSPTGSGGATLAIEQPRGSIAMALSLLTGLILSFVSGWLLGPFVGAASDWARAILGLILSLTFLVAEVGLLLVRYEKLDRVTELRRRHRNRRLARARQKIN